MNRDHKDSKFVKQWGDERTCLSVGLYLCGKFNMLVKLQKDMLLQFKPVLRKKLDEIKKQKARELEKMPQNFKTDQEKNQVFLTLM